MSEREPGSATSSPGKIAAVTARFGAHYGVLFFFVGVHMPYFPEWLAARGLSPWWRGVLLGMAPWARVVLAPWLGRVADRRGDARPLIALAVLLAALALVTAWLAPSPGWVFAAAAVFAIAMAPVTSLSDGLGVRFAAQGHFVYGRVRSVGSVGFILANLLGGPTWSAGDDRVIGTMIACVAALLLLALALPAPPAAERDKARRATSSASRSLARPVVRRFFVAAACVQLGHATVYAFGTATFERAGAPPEAIGWLWTVGVFAEILLFVTSRSVLTRLSPSTLLVVAGLSGTLRWALLASVTSLPLLFAAQLLHGLSFGAQHLATMSFIEREVDEPQAATGIVVALGAGVAFGVGMPLAGALFEHFGRGAYIASAAFSVLASGLALSARRLQRAD